MSQASPILSASRQLPPEQVSLLRSLMPGQRIKIVQTVRVGAKKWTTEATGAFRSINYLATGVTIERVPEDDVIVPMIHFTKDNGELSSVAIDENSVVELVK
jgi:hypothetical protein